MTYGVRRPDTKKQRDNPSYATVWLRKKVNFKGVNCKFFVQRNPDAASRLKFGTDNNRPKALRVEWLKEDWEEINQTYTYQTRDPVAYPLPGENPTWAQPVPETLPKTTMEVEEETVELRKTQ